MVRFMNKMRKVVLAYSGGLDTSVILKWLQERYGCEIVTFTADLGQGSRDLSLARKKAEMMGVREMYLENLQDSFVRNYVFPMFRANALYEGAYLLGTAIARPLIAKRQVEIARVVGADALCHGATGKGNDQLRFELAYHALAPDLTIVSPWRSWDLTSRARLLAFARQHRIPIFGAAQQEEPPLSADSNLLHNSAEGKEVEDPWSAPGEHVYARSCAPQSAPDIAQEAVLLFAQGDLVAIDGDRMSPSALLARLNVLGGRHGIGRLDLVENRATGMKSRGIYETPGGTILLRAHRAIESITLDREAAHLKDEMMPRYASLIYQGLWFSPEREMLQALIDRSQRHVCGEVRVRLYKGQVYVTGRRSPHTLYDLAYATFEEDDVYDQQDADGFIRLQALRLRLARMRDLQLEKERARKSPLQTPSTDV